MKRKHWRIIIWLATLFFLIANVIVYNHAYRFTHFSLANIARPQQPEELGTAAKLNALFFGVRVPKSKSTKVPQYPYELFHLQSHYQIEGWKIPVEASKGVVVLFHGYISNKSAMLPYAYAFHAKGYSTVLIDFMGHGGSQGLETTIGFKEGRDVKEAFDYVKNEFPNQKVILFGSSMGAAAIMKSIEQYHIQPDKIILECPFGSMLQRAKLRFTAMDIPPTPFAEWLILYGGLQTGFNAFEHKPEEYAKKIAMPTALFLGEKDMRVTRREIDKIFSNLSGEKTRCIFKNSAHEIYLNKDAAHWHRAVNNYISQYCSRTATLG